MVDITYRGCDGNDHDDQIDVDPEVLTPRLTPDARHAMFTTAGVRVGWEGDHWYEMDPVPAIHED